MELLHFTNIYMIINQYFSDFSNYAEWAQACWRGRSRDLGQTLICIFTFVTLLKNYAISQSIILLDTEFKPVTRAIILQHDAEAVNCFLRYLFPEGTPAQDLWLVPERLATAIDLAQAARR